MLRHAHIEEGGAPGLIPSKSFSGMFESTDNSGLTEHSGRRRPTRRFALPSLSATLLVTALGSALAAGALCTSLMVLSELRHVRAAQQASPLTLSTIEAAVKGELREAVSSLTASIKADLRAESSATHSLLQSLQKQLGTLDLTKHGDELRASIDTAHSKTHEAITAQVRAEASVLAAEVAKVNDKLATLEKRPPPSAPHVPARAPPPAARSGAVAAAVSSPAPPPQNGFVKVTFRYKPEGLPGNHALVYWLGRDMETEHLYADLPPAMEVVETTRPGECWRVRDATTGNDLMARYCATTAAEQIVEVGRQTDVLVDFHLPHAVRDDAASILGLAAPAAAVEVWEDATEVAPHEHSKAARVGTLGRGGHLSVATHAGARFTARELGTGRVLASFNASSEAKQYAMIGEAHAVSVEIASPASATRAVAVFHVRDDGEEHLHAALEPRATLRLSTEAGEHWVVKDQASDKRVLALVASTEPFQRVDLPVEGAAPLAAAPTVRSVTPGSGVSGVA